jgi:hypothetical protein
MMATPSLVPAERIERAILLIRGHKIMLDADIATLYRYPPGSWSRRCNETGSDFRTISCSG